MNIIFKIAKNELRNLFYSPVAWFLAIAFLAQCSIYYSTQMEGTARWQQLLLDNNADFKGFGSSLTMNIFLSSDGVLGSIMRNLYLFIPLLTMGLIAREVTNGTMKLLYSSPVTIRQIVFGKYLALMVYNIMLILILGIFIVAAILDIRMAEIGMLLSAALGFFLMTCAYTAIGMFMSSLSTYQIVTAISTFLLLFVLQQIGGLWQQFDFVRDLTYFLSISGRTSRMLRGLIATSDVIYFVAIVWMFVCFTLIKLKSGRIVRAWYFNAFRYLSVLMIALVVGYTSSRFGWIGYWDATRNDVNTIEKKTQDILLSMDEPAEITLYTNLLHGTGGRGFPVARNQYVWGLWEAYLRFKPDIRFKYVYYYDQDPADSAYFRGYPGKTIDQIAQMMAKGFQQDLDDYLKPSEIRKLADIKSEGYRLFMEVKYKGREVMLRTYDDGLFWPGEDHIAAAFKRLATDKYPKLGVTSGFLERNVYKSGEREFMGAFTAKSVRASLVNHTWKTDTVSLDKKEVPANIDVLLVADPKVKYSDTAISRINRYIQNGGNAIFLGEPGKQQILNPALQPMGVSLMDGMLIEVTDQEMPHMIQSFMTNQIDSLSDNPRLEFKPGSSIKDQYLRPMPGFAGVTFLDTSHTFRKTDLTLTLPFRNTWAKIGYVTVDSIPPVFNPKEGDYKKDTFTTMLSLTRKRDTSEQRIIVGGDADFMSNLRGGGGDLKQTLFAWLDNGEYPIFLPAKIPLDDMLNISDTRATVQRIIYIWVLPAVLLALGIVILIRRKRK